MAGDDTPAPEPDDERGPRRRVRGFRSRRHDRRRRGDEGDGGAGVREPRRPLPGGDADGVQLEPEEADE